MDDPARGKDARLPLNAQKRIKIEELYSMKPILPAVLFATSLIAAVPLPSLADSAAECRKMAAEEEVPAEDLEDYLAECMAVIESDSPDAAASEAPAPSDGAPAEDQEGQ